MINLYVDPKKIPMRWRTFQAHARPRSIALDGYVSEGPRFNPEGPWANFNHHDGVSRLETRATCAQVLMALRQGLVEAFSDETGAFDASVFVNDCDEDVCLSITLLRHAHLVTGVMNPLVNRLVFMEDMLDTTAGAYPFPRNLGALHQVMWVFNPYHRFRASGQLDHRNAREFAQVILDVEQRVLAYVAGKADNIELDTRYDVVAQHTGWVMVREIGVNARLGVFAGGNKAFVVVRELPNGRYGYVICRSSQFVPFPIPKFRARLNEAEGPTIGDLWGGGDFVIGSPRVSGSRLTPKEVTEIIERTLASR